MIACLLFVISIILSIYKGCEFWDDILFGFDIKTRAAIYSTIASITGSMLGFIIATTSILLGFLSSDKLEIVRKSKFYPQIWQVCFSTIRALSLTLLISLLGLFLDFRTDDSSYEWLMVALLYGGLLSLLRIYRSIWVLENVIGIFSKE